MEQLMANKKSLLIIDSNSVIHRAFHALPPLTTKKGEVINAIYGFLLVFLKAIRELRPTFVVACFDFPAPTFRHKKFKGYKAKRPPTPKKLYQQIPKIKEILKTFKVPIFEKEGFEADDLIGTISKLVFKKQIISKIETTILSGDSDALQLVNSRTKVYFLKRGVKGTVLYDEKQVREKYQGLKPEQLVDFKSLKGDPSDNIPGVTGIGEKTAIKLIKEFNSLEELYRDLEKNSEKVKKLKPKLKESLLTQKEQAFLSKKLAQIEKNISIEFNFKKCRWGEYDKEKIVQTLKELDFHSLIKRLPESGDKTNKEQTGEERLIGKNLSLW